MNDTTNSPAAGAAIGLGIMLVYLVILVAVLFIVGYPLSIMAKKKGLENTWFAYVPFLNFWLLVQISELPVWWIVIPFIPCVNIASIYIWMKAAGAMGKEEWVGLLMLIPGVNLFVPYYMAGLIGG